MRLSRVPVVIGAALLALIGPLVAVMPAHGADVGDNNYVCHTYEICYSKDNPSSPYQRDYYWSGNDTDNPNYWDHASLGWTYPQVLNNASSIDNRDTECDVWVVDWNQYGTARLNDQRFGHYPNTDWWQPFKASMNDRNDAHLRCNSY